MRKRFAQVKNSLDMPTLIGISAIGGHCSIYRYNCATHKVMPDVIKPVKFSIIEDRAPSWWRDINIRNQDGRVKLQKSI